MHEIAWGPGLIVLAIGLFAGLLLALSQKRSGGAPLVSNEPSLPPLPPDLARAARLEDLRHEKTKLLEAIKDIDDTAAARGQVAAPEERAELERRAADVLRRLHEAEHGTGASPGEASSSTTDGSSAPDAGVAAATAANAAGMSAEMRGMLKGGAVVAFIALVAFALTSGTVERKEGMGITGATPETVTFELPANRPKAGEAGGEIEGVPPTLRAKPSARVDQARAAVAANPDAVDEWVRLGYALVDAEGWIDVHETSRTILKMQPGHPDGQVLQAIVRVAMGQDGEAKSLIDEALGTSPDHLVALSWRGMIAYRGGDKATAKTAWTKAQQIAGPGEGFEDLIAMADGSAPPPSLGGGRRHPQTTTGGGAASPAPPIDGDPHAGHDHAGHDHGDEPHGASPPDDSPVVATPSGRAITGTIVLAPGATLPDGGALFLIARRPGVTRGPPVATRRLLTRSFPSPFALGAGDVMLGGPFPDEVTLTARFDADGNAMTKSPSDLVATVGLVKAGASEVVVTLSAQTP